MEVEEALKELCLNKGFTKEELGKAYRAAVKKYHTDNNKSSEAENKIRRINVAHDRLERELNNRNTRNAYDRKEDLSIVKQETLQSMKNMIYVDQKMKSISWCDYITEMAELFDFYGYRIKICDTKEEIENLKRQFVESIQMRMKQFAKRFFRENPHLDNHIEETFETIREQLSFYKKLIEEYQLKWDKRVISLVENYLEYKIAKQLLQYDYESLNNFICNQLKEKRIDREFLVMKKSKKMLKKI